MLSPQQELEESHELLMRADVARELGAKGFAAYFERAARATLKKAEMIAEVEEVWSYTKRLLPD